MDKKRNRIFVGCLALLLVMVAGYALFSQNLTINGTAKAQGDFSVAATCQPGIDSKIKSIIDNLVATGQIDASPYYENGYYDDSCTVKGDVVTYSTKLKYPGAGRYFTLKLKNQGNIDAILEETGEGKACFDENEDGVFDQKDECKRMITHNSLHLDFVEDKEGNVYFDPDYNDEAGIEKAYDSNTGALKPGATLYVSMYAGVNMNLTAKKNFLYESTSTSKVTFKQPTVE